MSRADPEQPMWNENNDNGVEDASAAGQEVSVEEFHSSTRKRSNLSTNRSLYLRIASSLFFLIGAALYLRMAVISIQFARENEIPSFDSTISSATSSAVDVDYSLLYWNQLPTVAKAAAQDLGYDQQAWDTGTIPAEADLWWDCLSPEQMEAAMVLGYNEAEWNGVEEDEIEATDTSGGTAASTEEGEYGAYTAPADPYAADDRRYTLLYIFASLCFVIVGVLDWMAVKKLYPALFVVAGLFGFISAIYVTRNVRYSNIFSAVSIHFFFLEAMALLWDRINRDMPDFAPLVVADFAFWIGATIELVLAYFYIFDVWADYDMEVQSFNIAAQTLWMICSLIYVAFAVKSWRVGNNYVVKAAHR